MYVYVPDLLCIYKTLTSNLTLVHSPEQGSGQTSSRNDKTSPDDSHS